MRSEPQEPDQAIKSDMARFLWNFLALRTASGPGQLADEPDQATQKPGSKFASDQQRMAPDVDLGGTGHKAQYGCDPYRRTCREGSMCVGWRSDAPPGPTNGQCLVTTARFVPSFSTSLSCKVVLLASNPLGPSPASVEQ